MSSVLRLGLVGAVLCFGPFAFAADRLDPDVVPSVDLQKYAGTWLEIAHAPNFFQRGCVRSKAEYAVKSPTEISVRNICTKSDGSTSDIEGVASVADRSAPTKLKVRFNLFARGDYWIVDLEPNYQWAVVSGPKKKSLFILARQAPMDPLLLKQILADLETRGFDTKNLYFDSYEVGH